MSPTTSSTTGGCWRSASCTTGSPSTWRRTRVSPAAPWGSRHRPLALWGRLRPACPLSSVPKPGRRLRSVEAAPGAAGRPRRAQPRADRRLPAPPGSSLRADGQGDARWGVTAGTVPSGGSECHHAGVSLSPQPLQAMESYLLLRALCSALGDNLGTASALCHVTELLLQLECPSYAQVSVTGREGDAEGPGRSPSPQPSRR